MNVMTFENLQQYHQLLMKQLSKGSLIPINICQNCGGIMEKTECPYCGTKHKWVIDN